MARAIAVVFLLMSGYGCNLIGPSCLARQKTGSVATVSGEVAPGKVAVHRVPYGTDGSQNDVRITWTGQHTAGGPQIRVYATKVDCVDFNPPADRTVSSSDRGVCANIGGFGGVVSPTARPCVKNGTCSPETSDLVQTSLIITHGRGNPDTLGSPAEYKLWVVGDPQQSASYTINTTWFYGPDC